MMRVSLTRRVVFSAAHRYRRPEWSEARNVEVFGLCARPNYHGHTYTCDVTVSGAVDVESGMLVDLAHLDRVLAQEVVTPLDHANLNLDIPEFAEGKLIPTGENIALWIFRRVQLALGPLVQLTEVRVAEDDRLSVHVRGSGK